MLPQDEASLDVAHEASELERDQLESLQKLQHRLTTAEAVKQELVKTARRVGR